MVELSQADQRVEKVKVITRIVENYKKCMSQIIQKFADNNMKYTKDKGNMWNNGIIYQLHLREKQKLVN